MNGLKNDVTLVLEVKGRDDQQNENKRRPLGESVQGVNQRRGFGMWTWEVSRHPKDIENLLSEHGCEAREVRSHRPEVLEG